MEKSPAQNQNVEISEKEKAELNRITYAKNMIQMQLALRKGFDGSSEEKAPEIFFEKYSSAFGDLIKKDPSIVDSFYTHQDQLESFLDNVEFLLEEALPLHHQQ